MRHLLVGDMHCTRSEIPDCRALIKYIKDICVSEHIDVIDFMGDQTNNHAIIDSYVMDFWSESFTELSSLVKFVNVIVGNHDQANSKDEETIDSMSIFDTETVNIVNKTMVLDGILYHAYTPNNAKFIDDCMGFPEVKTVLCHQSFNGAKYENGFPIEDGADADKIPQQYIFSGHIHNKSKLGKLTYVGSPRWRNVLDSNQDKSLLMVDFKNGIPISQKEFPTHHAVPKMWAYKDTEDEPCVIGSEVKEGDKVCVDIYGSFSYIELRRQDFPVSYRIRTFATARASIVVKESDGVEVALDKYLTSFDPKHGSDKTKLNELIKERLQ